MASGYSVLWANKINDLMFLNTAVTVPTSYWIGLFINASAGTHLRANDLASAQEVSGGSYVRMEIRGSTGIIFATSAAGLTSQDDDITWPQATGNWGSVVSVALIDASTAGNVVFYADLGIPKAVSTPDIFKIPAGFLQSQL
jgi:hypothetical protein